MGTLDSQMSSPAKCFTSKARIENIAKQQKCFDGMLDQKQHYGTPKTAGRNDEGKLRQADLIDLKR